jgi:Ca2+-binding RTX toxin-like protein
VGEADDGPSDSKTFVVTVANVAPTANDDQMNTTELVAVTSNLLDNDTDPGNDIDSASLKILDANAVPPSTGPLGGVVTLSALLDGNVTYAPNPGFVNVDSFRYEVCDDDGDCSSANVDVTVGPVDCNAQGVIRGTAGTDVLRGTAGNDVICAFAGNDRVYGSGGNDLLIGDAGLDRMWGENGNDVLRGGADTDAMDGGIGSDYLNGDTGRDVLMGRGGTDFLEMRDGSAGDAGNGGAGIDTCAKDQGDRTVSCERQ